VSELGYDDLDAVFEGYVGLDYNLSRSVVVERAKETCAPKPTRHRGSA